MDINEMNLIFNDKGLIDLQELYEKMDVRHLEDLINTAETYALWLIRAKVYLEHRSYFSQKHETAVKAQNRIAARVRKALGFSYPKQDINF